MGAGDDQLRRAIDQANLPTLLLVLYQLSGDRRWLDERYRPTAMRGTDDNDSGGLPESIQDEIRVSAFDVIAGVLDGTRPVPPPPPLDDLPELMTFSVGEYVAAEYAPMMAEEMGFTERWVEPVSAAELPDDLSVLVIGAGLSGIGLGAHLGRAAIPYSIVERTEAPGGTWHGNTYPGCGVDTPSHLYSFSFGTRFPWSRYYAKQPEIEQYVQQCADEHGVTERIRYGLEVTEARWEAGSDEWAVTLRDRAGRESTERAKVLISAVGQLNRPKWPTIDGLADFDGPVMHSAEWNHDVHIDGRSVAVIGTGASAMQIVPAIAEEVSQLTIFQRSPQWAGPNQNYFDHVSDDVQFLIDHVPYYHSWYRFRLLWMFNDKVHKSLQIDPDWPHQDRSINSINDAHRRYFTRYIEQELTGRPDLLAKSLPDYPPFGKRMLIDNGWYQAIRRNNVELVTDGIDHIERDAIVTADGERHECSVIVIATGFEALHILSPMRIIGRDGVEVHDVWGPDDAQAYLGISVPGFPNFFTMYGPNTNLGHGGSIIFNIECQARYITGAIKLLTEQGASSIECHRDVFEDYVMRVDAAHSRMIWSHPGMDTWYRNAKGRIVTNSPWRLVDYWEMTHEPNPKDYDLV
jgi:4-hydroxyacetophenone monooxygenase